jgi:2-keto-4-pentenoate hydratase/2-oxohepta-3-ene-1,7-dioic acid hydratase in catechol pathway
MRVVSFSVEDGPTRAGVHVDGSVVDTGLPMRRLLGQLPGLPNVGRYSIDDVRIHPPVPDPGKIMCIGRNYRDHAAEQDVEAPAAPLVFAKYASSLIAHGEAIELSPLSGRTDWEAELAVVIGRRGFRVSEKHALSHVAGYTIMNDVSARDLQRSDGQWTRAKSLDTFGPMGPELVTADEVGDPHALRIRSLVNGQLMQDAETGLMIHRIPGLIAYLSAAFTLEPGDVIATGTPAGVGAFREPPVFLRAGDVVRCEIERIGVLENRVVGPRGNA